MIRKLAALWIILTVLLALQAPAEAKGFRRAVIRGQGLGTPVVVRGSGAVGTLWSAAEYPPKEPHPYSSDLGPRYRVVFSFSLICPAPAGAVTVYLYPYASDGPELYTAPRQSDCGQRLSGGWAYGPASLLAMLTAKGLPKKPSAVASPTGPAIAQGVSGRHVSPPFVWALVVSGVLMLGALIGARRIPRRRASAARDYR